MDRFEQIKNCLALEQGAGAEYTQTLRVSAFRWLVAEIVRLRNELDGPVELPPSPETACKERSTEVIGRLQRLSAFAREEGRPGYCDDVSNAIRLIKNLTSSYLEACADNDRLSKIEDAALVWMYPRGSVPSKKAIEGLFDAIKANPRPENGR